MDSIVVKRIVEPQGDWNSRDTFKRVKIKINNNILGFVEN
jgi:hypothetical protein